MLMRKSGSFGTLTSLRQEGYGFSMKHAIVPFKKVWNHVKDITPFKIVAKDKVFNPSKAREA